MTAPETTRGKSSKPGAESTPTTPRSNAASFTSRTAEPSCQELKRIQLRKCWHTTVLFVSGAPEVYGSERSLLVALEGLDQVRAEVVCPPGGGLETALRAQGVRVYGLELNKYSFKQRPDGHIRFFLRFNRILCRSRPDVVVINLGWHTPIISVACMLRRVPVVRFQRFEFRPPKRWIDRFCLRKAEAIICPSKHVQRTLSEWTSHHDRQKVRFIYNPQPVVKLPCAARAEAKRRLCLDGKCLIGYFGRLHPQKRVETLIEALPRVRARFGRARALIVGRDDGSENGVSYADHLRDLAGRLGCQEAVSFLGYRNDVDELMGACELTVLPSETESFGRVLAESWSVGVPTVASDIPACREITEASGAGRLFRLGDHEQLAERIVELLAGPSLARSLGESGQKWVARECDPIIYARRLEKILTHATERSSARCTVRAISDHG